MVMQSGDRRRRPPMITGTVYRARWDGGALTDETFGAVLKIEPAW